MRALLSIDPWDLRRSCDCCGAPTLAVPLDSVEQPDLYNSRAACFLCEWESAPLESDGTIRSDAESDADRNDGIELPIAQANFARFASIYAPEAPPAWRVSAPDESVVQLRRDLQQAYDRLRDASANERHAAWNAAREAENQLGVALKEQQERDIDHFERAP